MNAVAYCQPFVPPEWISAHGLRPCWLPCAAGEGPEIAVRRGMCPAAAAQLHSLTEKLVAEAVVLTTTCDQVRYTAAVLEHSHKMPVFLMHVPRTWQTAAVRAYYRAEIDRLGRFLVARGGASPGGDSLAETMLQYDRARAMLRLRRPEMPVAVHAAAIAVVRGRPEEMYDFPLERRAGEGGGRQADNAARGQLGPIPRLSNPLPAEQAEQVQPLMIDRCPAIHLALVGGPMSHGDYELLRIVEDGGGRIALDATESGERTLPPPLDLDRLSADPWDELVRIYFDSIPNVFQRPNDRLFAWLRQEVGRRGVRGVIVRRHVWCDHWHGETPRLREELGLPLLEWDGIGNDPRARAGTIGRMEAFLEMLR